MDGTLIKLLIELAIPMVIFVLMCMAIIKETDEEYKRQDNLLNGKGRRFDR